ncbi:unnamed protein product [Penicillium glandicola]
MMILSKNSDDAEENDISRKGIEHALNIARNAEQHAKDVEEMLGYPGRRTEKSFLIPWEKIFLDLHVVDKDVMAQLLDFSLEIKAQHDCKFKSSDFDSITNIPKYTWHSQDPDIDARWEVFVEDLTRISNHVIIGPTLTKPTGNLKDPLTMVWNYSSWSSSRRLWGQVVDKSNPCLRMQYAKLGPSSYIKTQNRIPIQEHWTPEGLEWKQKYPNWILILEKCHELNVWLNSQSKIIILVGKENALMPRDKIIPMNGSMEILRIELCKHKGRPLLFKQQPWFEVIRDRTTKKIHHLVFVSYHTQAFFYDTHAWDTRVYHDLVWNAACGLAGIPVPRPMYFLRQGSFKKVQNPHRRLVYVNRAIMLRYLEKQNGNILSELAVENAFHKLLRKNQSLQLFPDKNGSFVGTIIRYYNAKAWEKQSTDTWRQSPEAAKMFDTAITNLLKPETMEKRIATNRALRGSEAWRQSTGGKNSLEGLNKGKHRPRTCNVWPAKVEAFLRTKQVQDMLSARSEQLTKCQRQCQDRLRDLQSESNCRLKYYFKSHVIWYSPFYPTGLRFKGDGCSNADDFPYNEIDHPAVKLQGVWKTSERRSFETSG